MKLIPLLSGPELQPFGDSMSLAVVFNCCFFWADYEGDYEWSDPADMSFWVIESNIAQTFDQAERDGAVVCKRDMEWISSKLDWPSWPLPTTEPCILGPSDDHPDL